MNKKVLLGISNKVPLFVIGFNSTKNEVIVGEEKELRRIKELDTIGGAIEIQYIENRKGINDLLGELE